MFRPQLVPVKQLAAGEVGYVATGLKSVRDAQVGDTVTTVARPAADAAARLPGGQEPRLRRHLPGQRRGLPAPARGAREAPPQRRVLHLRARELGRAGLRLPLRLPRPAPHGDRPGAARARVRARPHRLGAVGRVPGRPDPRPGRASTSTTRPCSRTPSRSRRSRSRGSSSASSRRRTYIGPLMELSTNRRGHVPEHGIPRPAAGRDALRAAARRADRRLLRPAQEPQPGLRLDGLRGDRLPRGQPRQARRPRRRRAGRRPLADRPPRQGPVDRARRSPSG